MHGLERRAGERGQAVEHLGHRHVAVVARVEPAVALGAREVERADGEVVDVDLEPERGHAAAGELHDLARAADGPALLEPALDEQVELHQLGHEARHGRLVEPGLGGDRRPRARAALGDVPQHDAEVVPAHGALIRQTWGPVHPTDPTENAFACQAIRLTAVAFGDVTHAASASGSTPR